MRKLQELKVVASECACTICTGFCQTRPCWPTPAEAQALIDAGFGDRLMHDWWEGGRYDNDRKNIEILCPAGVGLEGRRALDGPSGFFMRLPDMPCTFLNDGKCELHSTGFKPTEGRVVNHDYDDDQRDVHEAVAESWNNPEAQELFRTWQAKYGK